jgi:SH3 domain protein
VKRLLVALCLFSTVGLAQAETRYVTDQLEVTLRSGQSTQHQIIRMLPSGTAVQALEHDKDTGYSRVRTPAGAEGWVLTRYLLTQPAARERLEALEQRFAAVQEENRSLKERLQGATREKGAVDGERTRLENENRELQQQLAEIRRAAAGALSLDDENKTLKGRLLSLERELQTVHQENDVLRDRTARDWFMVGAGVLLAGMVVGLIIPKIRWRRRSKWDSF